MSLSNGHALVVDAVPKGLEPIDTALVYAPYLSAKLREKAERYRKIGVTLQDELAMTRLIAGEAAETYDRACRAADDVQDEAKRNAIKASAGAYLQVAMNNVRDMVMAAHRVAQKESLDPNVVAALVYQFVKQVDNKVRAISSTLVAAGIDPQVFVDELTVDVDRCVGVGLDEASLASGITPEMIREEAQSMVDSVPEVA